jgi:hypothetical protein
MDEDDFMGLGNELAQRLFGPQIGQVAPVGKQAKPRGRSSTGVPLLQRVAARRRPVVWQSCLCVLTDGVSPENPQRKGSRLPTSAFSRRISGRDILCLGASSRCSETVMMPAWPLGSAALRLPATLAPEAHIN